MSSILRTRDRDKIKANVIRQFIAGYSQNRIAVANRLTPDTVRGIVDRHLQQVHGAAGLMRIGELAPKRVQPYVCAECKKRNARTPRTIYKPCVLCAARKEKGAL